MSGLEPLLIAKGIALIKAHFAVAAVHSAGTTAAAHVPAAVAHNAAIHVAQTGVQAAASAPTATQAATTLASTAGLAYGIASQGGGMIGSAQRRLGRHGLGNPGPTVKETRAVDEMVVEEPVRFPEPAWTARGVVEENQIENEKPLPRISRRPVPVKASSNEKQARGQQQNQQWIQSATAGEPEAMPPHRNVAQPEETLEDQPYAMERDTTLEPKNAKSSLDFNGKVGESLFMFFRLSEIVLTPTTLGFIALSMSADGTAVYSSWVASTINGGSVFALLVTLWSLGFLVYRTVMAFNPALDKKVMALALELLTILLIFGGAMGLTFAFSCYVRTLLPPVAKQRDSDLR